MFVSTVTYHPQYHNICQNRRINDNLEQQAQALFKSWFVDFQPFLDGEFVESELGRIPKGWRVGRLGDLAEFKRGKTIIAKDAVTGNVPVIAGGMTPAYYHNVANTNAPVVTISASGANAGFMKMYHVDVWASDCSFIDNNSENIYWVYCYLALNHRLLHHAQTGAVQPHVKASDVNDFAIIIPPQRLIDEFQNVVKPFFDTKGNNEFENSHLETLRDTLLPKLMSGELKINELDN